MSSKKVPGFLGSKEAVVAKLDEFDKLFNHDALIDCYGLDCAECVLAVSGGRTCYVEDVAVAISKLKRQIRRLPDQTEVVGVNAEDLEFLD